MIDIEFPGTGTGMLLHNHSVWSDGGDTLEDMCLAAKDAGIRVFGMSDHLVIPPVPGTDAATWSMRPERIGAYCEEMRRLREKYQDDGFRVLVGLEVDYFHENHVQVRSLLSEFGFDYLIGAVHYSDVFPIDHDGNDWIDLPQSRVDGIWDTYWDKLEGAAKEEAFQIIAHFDLPKKFRHFPSCDFTERAVSVLEAVRDNGKAIEFNTAGWFKDCSEQYPNADILKAACKMGIPVAISTDAHSAAHVLRGVSRAVEVLREAGYDFK